MIDAHSHVYLPSYLDAMRKAGNEVEVPEQFTEVGAKLRFLEENEIDRALVSLGNPWLDPLGPDGVELAGAVNAQMAELAGRTDGRLLGMGVLPQASVETVVDVARSVTETRTLFGVITGSRICGRRFDDPALDPLWATLAETGLPMFVHPHYGPGGGASAPPGSLRALALGFPLETTIALADFIFAGVPRRFPGIKLIGAHCGGALPVLIGRFQAFWEAHRHAEPDVAGPPEELARSLAFDATGYSSAAVRAALELAGRDKLFFGTDHPFPVASSSANQGALASLSADERRAVEGEAAAAFFGLPAA